MKDHVSAIIGYEITMVENKHPRGRPNDQVTVIDVRRADGFPEWKQVGFPVEVGPTHMQQI